MNKFSTGLLLGGITAIAGVSYMIQDQKMYKKVMKKGKNMAVKAEEVVDDMLDQMSKN